MRITWETLQSRFHWSRSWRAAFVGVIVFLSAGTSRGQIARFEFDPAGSLQTIGGEIVSPPKILGQPQDQIVLPGEPRSFSVVVADTRGVSYQWLLNGGPIPNASSDSLIIINPTSADEGKYSVIVSSPSGSALSASASLFIDSDGDGLPDSWEKSRFGGLKETALGDLDGDGISNLQEYLDNTDPLDPTSALYRIALLKEGAGGAVVLSPDQPSYTNGQSVTLTAIVSGSEPFHGWTGDVITRSNSITLLMTTNRNIVVHFSPLVLVWTNVFDGDWNSASNWYPNLVPGTNDSVVIQKGVTITLDTDANVTDFTLGGQFSAPVLTGAGALTVNGEGFWTAGTMAGSGRTIIGADATLHLMNSSSLALNQRVLENRGSVIWSGLGVVNVGSATVISNCPGALFHIQQPAFLGFGGGEPARFDNAGTFRAAGSTVVITEFNNYGTAEIVSGTLALHGGGTNTGSLDIPNGATLNLASGFFTSTAGSSISGAGQFTVDGAQVMLAGSVNVSGINTFSAGTVNLTGDYIFQNGTLVISGGTANFDGTRPVSPRTLTLSSGVLGGAQTVTVGNALNWTGGSMNGTGRTVIPQGTTLTLANPESVFMTGRTLENGGTILWSGTGIIGMNNAVITNLTGALFDAQNAASIAFQGGENRFDNAGEFRKSALGTTRIEASFNNYNIAEVQNGTLVLGGGGTNNGSISVSAGTTLELALGPFASTAGSTIAGAGQFTVSGATARLVGSVNVADTNTFSNGTANLIGNYICVNNTLNISGGTVNFIGSGTVAPAILNLSSGVLGGTQTVAVSSVMNWTGGSMNGTAPVIPFGLTREIKSRGRRLPDARSVLGLGQQNNNGRTVIQPAATLTISNSESVFMTGRILDNGGTTLWTGRGLIGLNDSVITNRAGGLFNVRTDSSIGFQGGAPRFDNAGTFRKSVSLGTTAINSVPFNNYGVADIQSGTLTVNGGFAFGSTSLLGSTISGPGSAPFVVSSPVTLGGTLSINFASGFVPAVNDSFPVLSAGAINGAFITFLYPSNLVTMQLSNSASAVIALVTGRANVGPILSTPRISGTNVNLTWSAALNHTYRLEFNPDLRSSNWLALPGDVVSTGTTAEKIDLLTLTNRFYRLLVLP